MVRVLEMVRNHSDYKKRLRLLDSAEPFLGADHLTVGQFWSWAYSDLLCNTTRGVLAEFLVGAALRVVEKPRIEWGGYDLVYREKKIEVKAAGYLQSWKQERPSAITFDIENKNTMWDPSTGQTTNKDDRCADCYVFCLYSETEEKGLNPLDVSKWQFYVVSTRRIDEELGDLKRIRLSRLMRLTEPVGFAQLGKRVTWELFGDSRH